MNLYLGKRTDASNRFIRTTQWDHPHVVNGVAGRKLIRHQFLRLSAQLQRISGNGDDTSVGVPNDVVGIFATHASTDAQDGE
jgi:hypothetical protein